MAAGGAEEHFAKKLANNEKKVRDRAVIKLRAWLESRTKDGSEFDELDLLKIWKGLFYCMWMSDKPLIQEELAVNISLLIHSFKSEQSALLFIKMFFKTMEREWHGIDRLRLDKFYLLIRFFVKQTFFFLKENNWKESLVNELSIIYKEGPLYPSSSKVSDGICLHVSAIYLSELRIAMDRQERPDVLLKLLDPLFFLAAHEKNKAVVCAVKKGFFESIVDNSRGNAAENQEQTPLQVDIAAVIERLFHLASDRNILGRNRSKLYGWIKRLRKFSKAEQEVLSGVKENGVTEIPIGLKRKDAPNDSCDKGSITNKSSEPNNDQTGEGKPQRKKKKLHADEESNNLEGSGNSSNNYKLSTKEKGNQGKRGPSIVVFSSEKNSIASPAVKLKCKKNTRKPLLKENHKLMSEKMVQSNAKNESGKTMEMNTDNNEEKIIEDSQSIITNGFSESGTSVLNGNLQNSEELSCKLLASKEQMKVLRKKKSKTMESFAKFRTNSTPPAFVRKSIPKTDPWHNRKHKMKDSNEGTLSALKRVRIEVSKNTSHTTQDYKRSLKESPKIPFDALKTPTQGLLKSPPVSTSTPLNVVKSASVRVCSKKDNGKRNLKRSTAVDFF